MEIKTKFNVNDLVQTKRTKHSDDSFIIHEIMQIKCDTCYVGTQIFYYTRAIVGIKERIRPYSDNNYQWKTDVSVGGNMNDTGWKNYREDELIHASKEIKAIIEGEQK